MDYEEEFVSWVIDEVNGQSVNIQSTSSYNGGYTDFALSGLTDVISVGAWNVALMGML